MVDAPQQLRYARAKNVVIAWHLEVHGDFAIVGADEPHVVLTRVESWRPPVHREGTLDRMAFLKKKAQVPGTCRKAVGEAPA
jgi:hypothetical protein